jgi:hypothetical protein
MKRLDAHLLRRLLCGHDLDGQLTSVSDEFRPVAEMIAASPPADRLAAWNRFLDERADKDSIIAALAAVEVAGEPPGADEDDQAEAWPPVRLRELPKVAPFPVDLFPEAVAALIREGAEAIGCPTDFLGLAVLVVAAGAIGRSASLMLKPSYFACATIFGVNVGPPSDGKSPALRNAATAIRRLDEALERAYVKALQQWQKEMTEWDKKGPAPAKPVPRRIDVDDLTWEVIPHLLAENPRGLVMVRDELSALMLGLNQYKGGKGSDRANLLKVWSGEAIKIDRAKHEDHVPVRCPHPALSIVGNLTPDMLSVLADPKGRADGLVDRFLFAYPDPLPVAAWTERGIDEETLDAWYQVIKRLWLRRLAAKKGKLVPHVLRLDPRGKDAWKGLYAAHAAEMNAPDFLPTLRGPWGKLREYAGRLALVLACLDHAADPTADPSALPAVGARYVEDAWTLVDFFKSHGRRVHVALAQRAGIGGGPFGPIIVAWIREGRRTSFTHSELTQARRSLGRKEDTATLADALEFLTRQNVIRPREAPTPGPKGGRPPSPSYDVNPSFLVTGNPENPEN